MTPNEIEQLFSSNPPPRGSAVEEEEDASVSESLKSQRIDALRLVLATVRHLWETGSKDLDVIAEKIGNGVRNGSWRIPLGESQLLDFFTEIIRADGLRKPLMIHALRIIGNSCADTDQNRQRVVAVGCLPNIVKLLRDDSIIPLVAPVLFNICVDYEPAQVAAYKAGLNPEIIDLLSGPRLPNAEGSMGIICKLLRLVASQEPEPDLVHLETPFTLLHLAAAKCPEEEPASTNDGDDDDDDIEDFLGQVTVALTYLGHTQYQDKFLAQSDAIPLFLRVFSRACSELSATADAAAAAQLDAEELAQLKKTQSVFMQVLADLSAHPMFAALCPLEGPEVATLRRWIASSSSPSSSSSSTHARQMLGSAACLALGNVARSDAACSWLVETAGIHKPLIAIISSESNTDAQLLHAVLGFLKNLGIPTTNKSILGGAGLLDDNGNAPILPRLWQINAQPQVQFAAVSLARLLLVNCTENIRRVCAAATATATRGDDETATTHLQVLLDLFKETDQEPTKTEAARAVLSVCRALHTDTSSIFPPDKSTAAAAPNVHLQVGDFYNTHAHLSDALLFLGLQKKYPPLRSELWFVLALMARSPAGAKVVAALMQHRGLLETLSEAVTGENILGGQESNVESIADGASVRSEPDTAGIVGGVAGLGLEPQQVDSKQAASMVKVDRENGLVLINELMGQKSDDLSPLPLDGLRRILKEGGDLILANIDEEA